MTSMIWWCVWILSIALPAIAVDFCNSTDSYHTQLSCYAQNNVNQSKKYTLISGAPVQNKYINSLNSELLRNPLTADGLMHIFTQKTTDRIAHPEGFGAYGYFEVTKDFSDICKAKVFTRVGKRTPVATRYSFNRQLKGASETARDGRGFAVRFDTEEGIYSWTGLNTPVFPFKNAVRFSTFNRVAGRNPSTNAPDDNQVWDFLRSGPESIFAIMFLFTQYATPKGYEHLTGFAIHTFQVENEKGNTHFIRLQWVPDLGVKFMNTSEASTLAGTDPFYYSRTMYNLIAAGKYPSWTLYAQVLTKAQMLEARNNGLNIFDSTRYLFPQDYPLREIGRMVLNENMKNHFAETELIAFNPGDLVPGILGAPDQLFEVRTLIYRLAHHYRLGSNFQKIDVNRPRNSKAYTYNRQGVPPVDEDGGDAPPYYPNSFNGPMASENVHKNRLVKIREEAHATNFGDVKRYYEEIFDSDERAIISQKMANSLSGVADHLRVFALDILSQVGGLLYSDVVKELQLLASESS